MGTTKIEWTDRTWNPITGCTKISEGCANCYAERMAKRLGGRCGYDKDHPFGITVHNVKKWLEPFKWNYSSNVFVCSMGDLFHEDVPESKIDMVFSIAAVLPQHNFLILTKRPERMFEYFSQSEGNLRTKWEYSTRLITGTSDAYNLKKKIIKNFTYDLPPKNIWLGVTVENQARAEERIPFLLKTPAAHRFISVEPMLGDIDLESWEESGCPSEFIDALDWVICGGETGHHARPMHPDWVRSLRDQCKSAGVPFFFKGWGKWYPDGHLADGGERFIKKGKKYSGALLDGNIIQEFPDELKGV